MHFSASDVRDDDQQVALDASTTSDVSAYAANT
jgi:hypothetical protein